MEDRQRAALRELPSIDELLARPSLAAALAAYSRPVALAAVRDAVARARERLLAGQEQGFAEADVHAALEAHGQPRLRAVLNASGVVLHTNLGRAPLAERAVQRVAAVASGYCNVELDTQTAERGDRSDAVARLLCSLTGAEAALVVNNCAAAVLLSLAALAQGKQAIVSRGELVEIGGSFRVPDIMRQANVTLCEVGTTNRTRVADYETAVGPSTAALLKVHRSNFAVVGFTEEVEVQKLVELGQRVHLPVLVDLGSGALEALHAEGLPAEPLVSTAIKAGADVVMFSADKLLGGPQAGVIVGKTAAVQALKRHPLARALRVDKLCLAALEATLELYRDGASAEVPVRRMLSQPRAMLRARAESLKLSLMSLGVRSEVVATVGQVGGGSMPLAEPPSYACSLRSDAPGTAERLRLALVRQSPAVVARISDDQVLLDVRCLADEDLPLLSRVVAAAQAEVKA